MSDHDETPDDAELDDEPEETEEDEVPKGKKDPHGGPEEARNVGG